MALLHVDFPTILEVMRQTWFIVPLANIVIALAPLPISQYAPVWFANPLTVPALQVVNVLLFVLGCAYLLRSFRQRWALNKILGYNANPSNDNPIAILMGKVCHDILERGCFEIKSAESKPEKYVLGMIIALLDTIAFWEDC